MDSPSGYYNEDNQTIYPISAATWSGLASTTWATWTEWAYSTADTIIWPTEAIFMGNNPQAVNLEIICESTGQVSYKVYTSNTGVYAGEETETVIGHSATDVPAFKARFIKVVVYSSKINGVTPTISQITVTAKDPKANEYFIADLDSSACAGSNTARQIPLPTQMGTIIDIKITPQTVTAYALDVYVTNTATSTYLIPKVISKNSLTPTFALVGVDNQPRDGVVDIIIKSLSSSVMSGNNLIRV
jgi:hypothetical protein